MWVTRILQGHFVISAPSVPVLHNRSHVSGKILSYFCRNWPLIQYVFMSRSSRRNPPPHNRTPSCYLYLSWREQHDYYCSLNDTEHSLLNKGYLLELTSLNQVGTQMSVISWHMTLVYWVVWLYTLPPKLVYLAPERVFKGLTPLAPSKYI